MKIQTIHTVNGADVKSMNTDQKLNVLRDAEKKLADLKGIATPSKLVAKEIAKIEAFISDVNALFDADVK